MSLMRRSIAVVGSSVLAGGLLVAGPIATASALPPQALSSLAAVDPPSEAEGAPSQEAEALAESAATGEQVEVTQERTETETVMANPDGTLTRSTTVEPTRVEDASGELVDIDTTLASEGGDLSTVATTEEVTLDGDGQLGPVEPLVEVASTDGDISIGLGFDGELNEPAVDGSVALYPVTGVSSNATAVRVSSDNEGFAAHVVLDEVPDALGGNAGPGEEVVYRFPLVTEGATARLSSGALEFINQDGEVVGSSSTLTMWDAQVDEFGDPSNTATVDAALVEQSGAQVLELRPDPAFLTAADTEYPVVVDPDVSLGPTNATFITSAAPNQTYTSNSALRVGSNDGSARYESFVQFPTNALAGQTVSDAKLRLFQYAAGTCTGRRIEARAASGGWTGSGDRTWNNQGTHFSVNSRYSTSATFNASGSGGSTPNCGGASWQPLDVTGQMSSWAGGVTSNLGLYLTTPPDQETNTAFEKRFCSDKLNTNTTGFCRTRSTMPTLEVTYIPYIGDQGWYSTTDRKLDERSTLKINHESGNAYLAGNDVQVSSVGMPTLIGRRYNSRAEVVGQFGPKWTLSGGPDVWLEKIDQWRYIYHTPDGAELGPFVRKADQVGGDGYRQFATPMGGLGADLKDNENDTFTLTFHSSQEKYVFAQMGAEGHLYMTKQRDRSDNEMSYNYVSGSKQLSSITDTAGRTYPITYGSNGYITRITDSNGPTTRTWDYEYTVDPDVSGPRLTKYTDSERDATTYDWVSAGDGGSGQAAFIEVITDPANEGAADDAGNAPEAPTTTIKTIAGETIKTLYAGSTEGTRSEYNFTYKNRNSDPFAQCDAGQSRSAQVTSFNGAAPTTYCFADRLEGKVDANANNMKTTVFDGAGRKRSSSYSPDNQLEVATDDSGSTVNEYGDAGSGLMDRLDKSTQAADSGSQPASTIYKYKEDASYPGAKYLPVSMVDGDRNCTAYGYDETGRVISTWIGRNPTDSDRCDGVAGGLQYQATYNPDGTMATMNDPGASSAKTIFQYWQTGPGFVAGTRGMIKSIQRPGGNCSTGSTRLLCTEFTYDGLSRTVSVTDGNGKITRSTFDVMDRVTQSLSNGTTSCDAAATAAGECITYDYDAAGNLIQREDQAGSTTFGFDRQNRQIAQATPDGVEVAYTYNGDSRMATLTHSLPGQADDIVAYQYDGGGKVSRVTDSAGQIDILHNNAGRLQRTVFPTTPQTSIERTYTNSGKPAKIATFQGATVNNGIPDYTYTWTTGTDGNKRSTNQLQSMLEENSPVSASRESHYTYNNRGQLLSEKVGSGDNADVRYSYTYDDAGNIATAGGNQVAIGTRHFGYDRANQLCWTGPTDGTSPVATCPTTAPGTSKNVARDRAGNSQGDVDAPIGYNARNQAVDIDGSAQGYFDQGNDLHTTTGTTHLVQAKPGITARTTDTDGSGAPTGQDAETTFFTRMPDGRLLSSRGPDGTFYYVTDNNKTVLNLISATAQRAATYRYSPYGQVTLAEGTAAEARNPFRWISGYQNETDQPGGYIKLGARFFNPQTGAFSQQDPEMGNMQEPLRLNAYAYGGGDPINNPDPSGRWFEDDESLWDNALDTGLGAVVPGWSSVDYYDCETDVVHSTIVGTSGGFIAGLATPVTLLTTAAVGAGGYASGVTDCGLNAIGY